MIEASERAATSALTYVLVTAAYNEQDCIERTIHAVSAQTLPPALWVIVSDCSTDRTDEIVRSHARSLPYIRFLRLERPDGRNFVFKVKAVRLGFEQLRGVDYDFIGNLDADLSFGPTYFRDLIKRFHTDLQLGIGGGWICEDRGRGFDNRYFNTIQSVPHAVQLIRRSCYEEIGDYQLLPYGGEDTYAIVTAQMAGWRTLAFPDLPVLHHRPTAHAGGLLRNRFRTGRMNHSLGYLPSYELGACVRRLGEQPTVLGSIARLAGFGYAYLRRDPRQVPDGFVSFLRGQQKARLRHQRYEQQSLIDERSNPSPYESRHEAR